MAVITRIYCMCCFIIILQNYAANYWVTQGTPKSKLIIGMATYGRSFTLQDPTNFGIGAPVSGSGKAGNTTRSAGFLAYYEVRFIFLSKLKTAANISISVIYLATYGASRQPLFRSLISIYICCESFVMNISFFLFSPFYVVQIGVLLEYNALSRLLQSFYKNN